MVRVVLEVALGRLDERSPPLALERINEAWRPPGRSRARLGPAEVARLCALVRATRVHWRELEPGACLVQRWPLPELEVGLAGR